MLQAKTIDVTPDLAQAWLHGHSNYRPISRRHVAYLAAEMARGRWKLTGEPIVFDAGGHLLDGQHRLSAIVRSGVAVTMLVVSGVAEDALPVMDQGKARNARDVLRAGTTCAKPTQWAPALRVIAQWAGWAGAMKMAPEQLIAMHTAVAAVGGLDRAIASARKNIARDVCVAGISESTVAVCVWMAHSIDAGAATEWTARLLEMSPPPGAGDPEFAVHRAVGRVRAGSTLTAPSTASLIWASFRDRQNGRQRRLYRVENAWPVDGARVLHDILGECPL